MYQRKIQGNLDVSTIIVSVMEEKYIEDAKAQIISLMQDRRAVKVGESDNFHIKSSLFFLLHEIMPVIIMKRTANYIIFFLHIITKFK